MTFTMKQKQLYVTPEMECIALGTIHPVLQGSGQATAEDAQTVDGYWM